MLAHEPIGVFVPVNGAADVGSPCAIGPNPSRRRLTRGSQQIVRLGDVLGSRCCWRAGCRRVLAVVFWSGGERVEMRGNRGEKADGSSRPAGRETSPGGASGRMAQGEALWLAWYMCALSLGLSVAGLTLLVLSREALPGVPVFEERVEDAVIAVGFSTLGAVVAPRFPSGNAVGWLFCALGLVGATLLFCGEYAAYSLLARPGSLPGGCWRAPARCQVASCSRGSSPGCGSCTQASSRSWVCFSPTAGCRRPVGGPSPGSSRRRSSWGAPPRPTRPERSTRWRPSAISWASRAPPTSPVRSRP